MNPSTETLFILGLAAGAWWWWQKNQAAAAPPPTTTGPTGSAGQQAAQVALYNFLNANYHLPATVDPNNLAAAGINTTSQMAVAADKLPTSPAFPAGTEILIYISALPQLNALIVSAGGTPITRTVSGGTPPTPDATAAKAAMDAFLAGFPAAPAGYSSGDSVSGVGIVRGGKLISSQAYPQWQQLHADLAAAGLPGYGV